MAESQSTETKDGSDLVALGERLQQEREALGLSAREVAEQAGLSPVYLRAIERASNPKTGRPSTPSPDALIRVTRALHLSPAEYFGLAGYSSDVLRRFEGVGGATPPRRGPDDLLDQIADASRSISRRSPFLQMQGLDRLAEFAAEFRMIGLGRLRCTPDEESYLVRRALEECCHSHLRAVSYQDEPWWTSDLGDQYLAMHEVLRDRDVEMTRIFLVSPDALTSLAQTLKRHVELGIHTYVVAPSQVSDQYWRDFVIYDDVLVRTAVTTDLASSRKYAEFSDDRVTVDAALEDFKTLFRLASPASSVMKNGRTVAPPPSRPASLP